MSGSGGSRNPVRTVLKISPEIQHKWIQIPAWARPNPGQWPLLPWTEVIPGPPPCTSGIVLQVNSAEKEIHKNEPSMGNGTFPGDLKEYVLETLDGGTKMQTRDTWLSEPVGPVPLGPTNFGWTIFGGKLHL